MQNVASGSWLVDAVGRVPGRLRPAEFPPAVVGTHTEVGVSIWSVILGFQILIFDSCTAFLYS